MRRDPRLYIDDILDAISNIREYTTGQNYEIFQQDRKTRDAVVRNLEIIGEAAGRLPDFLLAAAPKIEWRKIVGLRNILAHEYFSVSIPVVCNPNVKRILFFCYNITLVNFIRRCLAEKKVPLGENGVDVLHFFELCAKILGESVSCENEETAYYDIAIEKTLRKATNFTKKNDAVLPCPR